MVSLSWVSRDGKIIILARGVRGLAQGFLSVILAVYLDKLGFSLVQIGVFFSAGVAGCALFSFLVGLVAERLGRRRLLLGFSLMTCSAGLALVLSDQFLLLLAFSFLGTLSGQGGAASMEPARPLEQASLADAAASDRRTEIYAVYRIVSTTASAVGSLAAGLTAVYQEIFGLSEINAYRVMFVGFSLCLLCVAFLYSLLSAAVEVEGQGSDWTNPLRLPSRRIIFTLTGLFSIDHFAGSLVIQSLIAYWFKSRFGLEVGPLALVFFFSHIFSALSVWVAAKLANRIGFINTMVFTHIPASLFLIFAAFAPTAWLAVLFWQIRVFLAQMDTPARDAYTMAIVGPGERVAMASIHSMGRSIAGTVGPSAAALLWQVLSASAPLIACAGLKILYDVSLYVMFRNLRAPGEVGRPTNGRETRRG